MSWLFSQALVAAFSADTCSDGEPFAPSSGSPIPQAYSSPDRMTAFSRLSRFGMTFAPLTDTRGEELLTWFRAGFRARTYPSLVTSEASRASGLACGRKWRGSLAKYDLDTSSWRTPQCSLFEDLEQSLDAWPRWGLMRNGECWERPTWERRTREIDSGWWPTLKASDHAQFTKNLDYFKRRQPIAPDLPVMVALRTGPTPQGFYGRLNPDWTEWLMGIPTGWTELQPKETHKFRNALLKRGVG